MAIILYWIYIIKAQSQKTPIMNFPGLILIDGSSYLYRAYHALPPLTNSKGKPTGAIFGVINMLRKLIKEYQPQYCAVVFDTKGKTFRDELYEKYKAHRPVMPDDLQQQIEPLYAIIRAMGLPLLAIDGVEADDVIGTLAKEAEAQHLPVLISTGDKDMAQLVNAHIKLTNTMTNSHLDEAGVFTKFGVRPDQIIDYLCLVGDSSDNVPGVPGVGPKTAAKWLNEWQTLDKLILHAQDIGGKVGENLRSSLEQFTITKALTAIKCDVKLDCQMQTLKPTEADQELLQQLFLECEFKTWLSEINNTSLPIDAASNERTSNIDRKKFTTILTADEFNSLLTELSHHKIFAVDTETDSLDTLTARLVGISIAFSIEKAFYIPLLHDYLGAPQQLSQQFVLENLKPFLEGDSHKKILQNAKFDLNVFWQHGIHLKNIDDTQLESYVLQSNERHDLDSIAEKFLHHKNVRFEDIAGKGVKQLTFNQIDLEQAAPYAAEDAAVTFALHKIFSEKLQQHPKLTAVLKDIELPLMPILAKMEREGVLIDAQKLHHQSKELNYALLKLEQHAHELAGQSFNLNSPKQLQEILYGKLQLPVLQKTPTGQPSTAEDVLQDLAYEYELPGIILQYRSLSKLKSTYTDRLPEQIAGKTGRIHTSYNQAIVPTGRLSSSDPNLQNIPIRTPEGRRIRQAFIAPPGYKILSADYSQIELRIMAHLSQDKSLLDAFHHNADIHRATASEVFSLPLNEVSDIERRNAKAINFGLIYGMSAFGLSKQLSISREAAQAYINKYFTRYPGVKAYMDNTRAQAHAHHYVETLFGRRLYLPEITARQQMRVKAAERAAINGPLQGSSADIIKRAMIKINHWLESENIAIRLIMQVHDELVFEVREDLLELAKQKIPQLMSSAASLDVPLLVDVGVGDNWDEAH